MTADIPRKPLGSPAADATVGAGASVALAWPSDAIVCELVVDGGRVHWTTGASGGAATVSDAPALDGDRLPIRRAERAHTHLHVIGAAGTSNVYVAIVPVGPSAWNQ